MISLTRRGLFGRKNTIESVEVLPHKGLSRRNLFGLAAAAIAAPTLSKLAVLFPVPVVKAAAPVIFDPLNAPLIFPLVRRVYPRYVMHEIMSIQPIDSPWEPIYYLQNLAPGEEQWRPEPRKSIPKFDPSICLREFSTAIDV